MIYSCHHVSGVGASGHNKSISIEVGSNKVFMFFLFGCICVSYGMQALRTYPSISINNKI
jgi:hypothetical protein